MVRLVMLKVLDEEVDVERRESGMTTAPPPLVRCECIEAVGKPIALGQKRLDSLASAVRGHEIDETSVALGRVGLELRFIAFEHRVDPMFEQLLNPQQMADQLGERPLFRLDSALKRIVAKTVSDAPDVVRVLPEARDQLMPQLGRHVRTRAGGTHEANPA
jgi:hypothetical protein